MSHDQIGDVIIVKLPESVQNHSTAIGEAMLKQNSNARVICADNGVKGEFRVRDLSVIASIGSNGTLTKVRESGCEFWVDPGAAYYSPRLANERQATVNCAKDLTAKLGRKISVCDPYAGVGPALVPLANTEIIDKIFASDLNPNAADLLAKNLPSSWSECRDARSLAGELPECCDLLLVNLPHDSIDHLPDLLGLLRKGHEVVIRGWAIIPIDSLADVRKRIVSILSDSEIVSLDIEANRSYSPNDTYACFEAHIIRN
jgi:tRNA G37 N-methylase Trm5